MDDDIRFQDLAVYRDGAQALLDGTDLYPPRTAGHGQLVFTYPPFAALVFAPFALIGGTASAIVLALLTTVAYLTFVGLTGRQLRWSQPAWLAAALLGLMAEPALRTIQQGQVNLLLAALVVIDVWVLPRRCRGLLVGVAAGVKLVPGIFALYYVAQRDWQAALRSAATGLATIVLAWIAAPSSSHLFWTRLLFDPSRSGGGGYPDNQSIAGVVSRFVQDDHPSLFLTLPLQLLAVAAGYGVARRLLDTGREVPALVAIAIGGLLSSPVSWSHHWVWCIPLVMVLVDEKRRPAAFLLGLGFVLSPLTLSPLGWFDSAPRPVWLVSTMIMPVVGVAWLALHWRRTRAGVEPASTPAIVSSVRASR